LNRDYSRCDSWNDVYSLRLGRTFQMAPTVGLQGRTLASFDVVQVID